MKTDHHTGTTEKDRNKIKADGSLRVLLVGDQDSLSDSSDLLKSMRNIGYNIAVLGAVTTVSRPAGSAQAHSLDEVILEEIRRRVSEDPPDVLIQTTDNAELFKQVVHLVPARTRILDPFVLKVVKGLRDVSGELAQTRTKLQTVELIKQVLMSGPEMSLMVVDEDLIVLELNNAILKRARMGLNDCLGRPCHLVLRKKMKPSSCPEESCVARGVLGTGLPVHTVRQWGEGDAESYFTVSAYPLGTDERSKKNVLIIWKDITPGMTQVLDRQAKDMRESFLLSLKQDKMAALGQLAAAAVHEINNPIQGILTFAKLMRQAFDKDSLDPGDKEKFKSYLDLIAEESARCGRILRNLLSFARLGNLEKSAFDFAPLLDEVFMLVLNRAELRSITLSSRLAADLLPVYGDRGQIKQVMLNLVINSLDAMPDGGSVTVSAEMSVHRDHVRIRVADTGIGIPKFLQSSIWEPFVTAKESGTGVGLGLSVVYGVVTQHGGSVDMQSEENKGTVFTVTFPVFTKDKEHEDS